jgi:predicted acylesterase/phospholipase RssA
MLLQRRLFQDATLASLPEHAVDSPAPEFFINATNLQTGNLFVFTRKYIGDSEVCILCFSRLRFAV